MIERIIQLRKEETQVELMIACLRNAVGDIREAQRIGVMEIDYIATEIENKIEYYRVQREKVWNRIDKIQSKCSHKNPDGSNAHTNWKGNDHNWDYYACEICGHQEQR